MHLILESYQPFLKILLQKYNKILTHIAAAFGEKLKDS